MGNIEALCRQASGEKQVCCERGRAEMEVKDVGEIIILLQDEVMFDTCASRL